MSGAHSKHKTSSLLRKTEKSKGREAAISEDLHVITEHVVETMSLPQWIESYQCRMIRLISRLNKLRYEFKLNLFKLITEQQSKTWAYPGCANSQISDPCSHFIDFSSQNGKVWAQICFFLLLQHLSVQTLRFYQCFLYPFKLKMFGFWTVDQRNQAILKTSAWALCFLWYKKEKVKKSRNAPFTRCLTTWKQPAPNF